ncbi:hypothetical protein NM208_g8918 [Fusarium decemcellulare]|uniref:Uncharacterized protein n=1 Tax=Fusarium decemcellulare TaxID=57161 RepID=A0ACC1S3G3_9HYPO|nr:hypothetical protein NM208_g8918 [Fusarium decemcellulare]
MTFSRTLIYAALAIFGKTAVSAGSPTPGNFSLSSIKWTKCDMPVSQIPLGSPVPDSVDCGRLTVPLDHYNPSHGTIELGMMRLKAKNPDCTKNLFYNSGGPGMPSSILVGRQALWEAGKLGGTRPPGLAPICGLRSTLSALTSVARVLARPSRATKISSTMLLKHCPG